MNRNSDNPTEADKPGDIRRENQYLGGPDGWQKASDANSTPPANCGDADKSACPMSGMSNNPTLPPPSDPTAAKSLPSEGIASPDPSGTHETRRAPNPTFTAPVAVVSTAATPTAAASVPATSDSVTSVAAASVPPTSDSAASNSAASDSVASATATSKSATPTFTTSVAAAPTSAKSAGATSSGRILHIRGVPNAKQKLFFASKARYTAYGGARGGGKSWALRRKLISLCLRYPGIRCLLVRRSYAELKSNHVRPMLSEYRGLVQYRESDKCLFLPNGSSIVLGYCSSGRDTLRYQGQEYDIIAIDEATQLSEYQFSVFKACLRGVGGFPRRMYLTCNPGGVGHGWVKRLFVDRCFRADEHPDDYLFIPAQVYDNPVLLAADPDYVRQLESLPPRLRDAWLLGRWDVFEGQFLPEFQTEIHVCSPQDTPNSLRCFAALDYGFDMLAALLLGADADGRLYVLREVCRSGLTLREAALAVSELCSGAGAEYLTASPDLWNRRQDTGRSGFEVMQAVPGVPPMCAADNRRIPGWRMLREFLSLTDGSPRLRICSCCRVLIQSLPALLCDTDRPEDASDEPHAATHAPEALRYAVMSRFAAYTEQELPDRNFKFPRKSRSLDGF